MLFLSEQEVLPHLRPGIKFSLWEGKVIGSGEVTRVDGERDQNCGQVAASFCHARASLASGGKMVKAPDLAVARSAIAVQELARAKKYHEPEHRDEQ